ncbi:hypothetical protein Afil01_61630 [Actinorhabdospora filicis]|uniref:Uncharacterized protein n=1 Tax=Actinorhabdospora filicis TaxID=1785913 RepID=A0A9W6SV74_9ACTN|nr:hypothetical protein [Actinorhabdospora filicis]GLZ81356.1 hypothetical protein Afil01_61630 [Actinorhabdospora filicis]
MFATPKRPRKSGGASARFLAPGSATPSEEQLSYDPAAFRAKLAASRKRGKRVEDDAPDA